MSNAIDKVCTGVYSINITCLSCICRAPFIFKGNQQKYDEKSHTVNGEIGIFLSPFYLNSNGGINSPWLTVNHHLHGIPVFSAKGKKERKTNW